MLDYTFDEDIDEGDSNVPANPGMSYRAFRADILAQCRDDWTSRWGGETAATAFAGQRKKIRAFRHHLVYYAAGWIASGRYPREHIYRALGLDAAFTLTLSRRERWLRAWMRLVPSANTVMRVARPWLRLARTFEGRSFIARERLPRGVVTNKIHFDRALDYGVMRWGAFPSSIVMDDFSLIHFDWIRAAHHLGLDDPESILKWVPRRPNAARAPLMWILVREGAITRLHERAWLDAWYRPDSHHSGDRLDERRIGEVIRILRGHGVEREQIVKTLCTVPHHFLKPEMLGRTLALLWERGIKEYDVLLAGLDNFLFNVAAERWMLLLDQFGIRDSVSIAQFAPLLSSSKPCSVQLGLALIENGATVGDLVLCQNLMLAAGAAKDSDATASALALLLSPPHSLQFAEIAQAASYVCNPEGVRAFLDVLHQHDFVGGDAVLSFQPSYTKMRPTELARLLALTRPLSNEVTIDGIVKWVQFAGDASHLDSYEYLARALKVRTVRQLVQVGKLGFLGVDLLRHLIERRGLGTRKALTDWYYDRAFAIRSVRWWGSSFDPINMLLFDDAFERQAFNYWDSNQQCIYAVVHQRILDLFGHFPFEGSEEEQNNYRAATEVAAETARVELLPVIPPMLQATSGILFRSIAASGWGDAEALTQQLAQLSPLLDDLLAGRGPVTSTLNQVDAEAIALVYRTAPETVRGRWQSLIDHQNDIAAWGTASSYSMTWFRSTSTLREPLDRVGFEIVGNAVRWAANFRETYTTDMARACAGLEAQSLDDPDDLAGLMPRLGVLLAVAADHPTAVCLQTVMSSLVDRDDGWYEQVLSMQTFFSIGLTDVLQACGKAFCQQLTPRSAALLEKRLGGQVDAADDERNVLLGLLEQTTRDVVERFGAWTSRELAKFGKDRADDRGAEMSAVVTKHPAAFFAKEAAKLCTADNVLMWQETRQAHLVVFDLAHRSFQGMALLYREVLPQVHPSRPVLVIRAINPTGDAMAAYRVSSIVDAFLTAAVLIARDSGCVAVAFPPNTTQHLLSNLDPVDKDIQERYVVRKRMDGKRMEGGEERLRRPVDEIAAGFDAYERGANRVGKLYVVWHEPD